MYMRIFTSRLSLRKLRGLRPLGTEVREAGYYTFSYHPKNEYAIVSHAEFPHRMTKHRIDKFVEQFNEISV